MASASHGRDDALAALTRGGDSLAVDDVASAAAKRARRATAIYPTANKPNKPFSRSAAKRESVLALGSIEHLQHYFTKTGMRAKVNPLKPNSGAAPALGPLSVPSIIAEDLGELPPSPAIPPTPKPRVPFAHTYVGDLDPEAIRPGVIRDLANVARVWHIDDARCIALADTLEDDDDLDAPTPIQRATSPEMLSATSPNRRDSFGSVVGPGEFDVLGALLGTTRAIRSVRNYTLALPDDGHLLPRGAGATASSYRPRTLGPRPSLASIREDRPRARPGEAEPLARIRRAALETLGALRELEERARVPGTDATPAEDALSDHGSATSAGSRAHTPSASSASATGSDEHAAPHRAAVPAVSFRPGVQVWSDDEDEGILAAEDEQQKRERWDERLVLGGGWLYRHDVGLAELAKEQDAVRRWLHVAEDVVLAPTPNAHAHAPRRPSGLGPGDRRAVSAGTVLEGLRAMAVTDEPEEIGAPERHPRDASAITEEEEPAEDGVDDAALPNWARRAAFVDDPMGRAHALLAALLPPNLLPLLPLEPTRPALLEALASGQLLCIAYNTGVRRSRKPWGYIAADAIHDVAALDATRAWTFRRTDNLRLWAAALRLRYLLPLADGAQVLPTGERATAFDPRAVARKDKGWEDALAAALGLWVDAVVRERREH